MAQSPPIIPSFVQLSFDSPKIQEAIEAQPQVIETRQHQKAKTCLERASDMIDNITDSLYAQILTGLQVMKKRRPIFQEQDEKPLDKKKSTNVEKTVDIDLHKRMIRKFKRMNRKSIKSIEQRSLQFQQQARKKKQAEINRMNEQKNRTLELRREKISQRLKSKEALRQEIHKFVMQANKKYEVVKSQKFLYQQKQEAFNREFILPKIEQQKRILMKFKQKSRPIDIKQLYQHQKLYEQKLANDKLNRSLTSRVIQSDNFYEPPKFIPKSFLIAQAQQQLKKEQQKMKQQQLEINQYRKKQFIKIMEEKHKQEMQKQKQLSLEKSRSNKTFSIQGEKSKRQKPKVFLNREQTKKIGNQYMKQLIGLNRSYKAKRQILQYSSEKSIDVKPHSKSQYEIQLIKEERIQKVQKIRLKKIQDILNNKSIDKDFKLQRLKYQNDKFDNLLSIQQDNLSKKSDADELASIVLSSIHTKLAILEIASPKC